MWSIRVDVHFLDDEGNMLDCASIAAITALRHFRRPDVTVIGEDVTIVSGGAWSECDGLLTFFFYSTRWLSMYRFRLPFTTPPSA